MNSGAKIAVGVGSVIFVALILLCGGGGLLFYFRGHGFSSLSSNYIPTAMSSDGSLNRNYYVSHQWQCRIRLPRGPYEFVTMPSMPEIDGGFEIKQAGRNIVISQSHRGSMSFDTYVTGNRRGVLNGGQMSNVHLLNEGRTKINGNEGYILELTCDSSGESIHERMLIIQGPGDIEFLVVAAAKSSDWYTNVNTLESSLSTFQIGDFPDEPPEVPNFGQGQPIPGIPGQPNIPNIPPPPRPIQVHLTFQDAAEAARFLRTGRPEEKRAAAEFLATAVPDNASHADVISALTNQIADTAISEPITVALKTWADKSDVPQLQSALQRLEPRAGQMLPLEETIIDLLAQFPDPSSVKVLMQAYRNSSLREFAAAAIEKIGPAAEDALVESLKDRNNEIAIAAATLLGKVGTIKSVLPLQRIIAGKNADLAAAATDALQALGKNRNLKPDQYLNNLVLHYVIDAPTGFIDDKVSTPQTRQWSKTSPGRAVKSVYTVTVKLVPTNYRITTPPNAATLDAGTLTFHQVNTASTNATQSVEFQALDGEYLIDLTATRDNADAAAGNNMTNAAKKIHVNPAN